MATKDKEPKTAEGRMKKLQSNYVDLTKTGPLTYRELAYLMGDNRPYTPSNSIVAANQPRPILENLINSDKGVQYIQSDYGNSMFDPEGYATEGQLEQLNDIRAENQPWYAQIGAGLAKGVVLAGTTFLDGTLGLILGGTEAIAEGDVSRLWDNDFSKAMQSINDWSEEAMPNYYSREELEEPWYKNIFTANWLGDKFLKNLGFSIGALYSGGVYTSGLKALKIPQLVGKVLKSTAAPKIVQSAVGATISAVNEGRIEALNNSNDWQDLKMQELDDMWSKRINDKYAGTIQSLTDEYYRTLSEFENTRDPNKKAQAMALGARLQQVQEQANAEFENRNSDERYRNIAGRIAEDRLKMGNMDLLMNIPILTASNVVQFTKYYARGFNTARKAGITGSMATGYAGREFSKLGAGVAIAKAGLSEGTEEISQKAASLVSGNYYSTDVNNYRKSQFDKNASQETLDWVKAFATGINETVNDASSWEEFTIGALTGFMGVPMFRGFKSADGKVQSPIYLEGGAREAYRNYKKDIERSQEIANYLNSRVQSPEFQNYYRGLVRHNKYQNDMNQAAMDDDEFNYKNAEYAQFVSDINMFDNAGRLEDLKDYISNMYDVSDEELEAIIDKTTSKDADGKSIGPFIDKNGNRLTSTEEGKQEMKDKLTKEKDSMLKTINNYRKTKDNLDAITGGTLTDDQLSELTWMNSQIDNWNERVGEMIPLVRRAITDLITNRRQDMSQIITKLTKEGKDTPEMSKKNTAFLTRLETLSRMSDKQLKNVLTNPNNKDFVKSLAAQMDIFGSETIGAIDTTGIKNILRDIPKIGEGIKLYNEKLAEYLKTPAKLAADQATTDEKAAKEFKDKARQSFREKALAAKNIAEFKQAYDEEQDDEVKEGVLKDLITDGNEVAKNYKDVSQYDEEINNTLNSSGENSSIVEDAKALWLNHVKEAENLESVGNPNSVHINDEQAFLSDSDGDIDLASNRFQNARYALLQAMSKVNNDLKFRDRFAPEYKVPVDESLRGKDNITRETTGNSQTPTLPQGPNTPRTEKHTPVGNITTEEVAAENTDNNNRGTEPRVVAGKGQNQKKFYRPTIPELHIEASKEGDFRPFNVVVSEREPGKDFTEIYNYLRDNGAFDYVNSGKLKAGQTLLFMIDPEFEASVEGKPWHKAPTVFLTTEDGQIVGSLDEGSSLASFEGLENVVQKVRDEYQASRKSDTVGASPVALSYLLENGVGTIESTGYFLHAVAAAFPVISEGIESIRNSINTDILSMNPDGFVSSNHPAIKRIENLIRSTYGEEGVDIYNDLLKNSTGYIPAVGKKIEGRINNLTPKKETPATLQEVVDNLISTVEADNTGIDTDSVSSIKDKVNQIDTILKKERGAITQEDTASLESLFNELEDAVSKIKAINDDTLYTKVQKLVVDLFLRTNSRLGAELYEDKIDVYNIKGTLSRVEEGVAIYVDESGETNVILMGTDPHTMIGLFRESGSNRWSIKMENKNNPEMFKYLISSVMPHLPVGAEIYERTSISLDGLRVFAKQLEHGFRIGDETYETYINGADIKNAFGVSEKSQQNMNKVHISEDKFPEVKEKLRPYLEKFGITDIDSAVTLGERGTIKVKLPVIVKTDTTTQNTQELQALKDKLQAAKEEAAKKATETQPTKSTTPNTSRFFATPKTRVSKIMVGKIPYSSEERSLADIPGVSDGNTEPIFGIIRNGVLTTNGKVRDSLIIKPVDMAKKDGRLYLLIPNAAGTYSPVAVRVKHFNAKEFNLDDATVASTLIGKKINEVITKLAESTSDEDVTLAVKDLIGVIYSGDLHIDYFSSKKGEGIRIVRTETDDNGNEIYITDDKGNRVRKEDKRIIYFSNVKDTVNINGLDVSSDVATDSGVDMSAHMVSKDINTIRKEIINALYSYNLPLQVSISHINKPGYNKRAISSNMLTSNLQEAKVIDNWFTTDYFDAEGKLQKAVNPPSVRPDPNTQPKRVVQGTKVTVAGTSYIVDLKHNILMNEKTKAMLDFKSINYKNIIDMAWAQDLYGDATESSRMTDNKIITPEGRVLDRNTGKYLTGEEAQRIKDKIAGRDEEAKNRVAKSKKVVAEIYENQKKVDKTRTDSNYYYVLEDDGQYHKYDRVHSRLGDNWLGKKIESENSRRALEAGTAIDKVIRDFFTSNTTPVRPDILSEEAFSTLISRLTEIKSNMEQMGETFLTNNIVLFHKYADGSRVAGEVDILSVDKNGNFKIYDVKTSRYSFSDRYFNEKSSMQRMSTKDYYTLQLSAYQNLFESQYGVRPTRLAILPFVLTHGTTQAAAVDIPSGTQTKLGLPIDSNQSYFRADRKVDDNEARFVSSEKDGKVYFKPILDTKAHEATLRSTDAAKLAVEFIGGDPKEASSFVLVEPGEATRNSENGRLMISKKAKVFAVTPSTPYSGTRNVVTSIAHEQGIPITYNPAVNVPLESRASAPVAPSNLPIFDSTIETMNPENRVLPENAFEEEGEVGYYEIGDKVYKGYLRKVGEIEATTESGQKVNIPIYTTKIRDHGFGREGELGSTSQYLTVFPNGKALAMLSGNLNNDNNGFKQAQDLIISALSANPAKVLTLSSEQTQISAFQKPGNEGGSEPESTGGAERANQTIDNVNVHDDEFEDDLELRRVDNERQIWDEKKELSWLRKVLPQLSEQDRVKVVKGLIQVAKNGPVAWGMVSNGIMTLSDIAAEGTAYHEAFHVVFHYMLTPQERAALFEEAGQIYGVKSKLALEEDMAEGFREYVTSQEKRGLGRRILDFFRNLFAKITNWKYFKPSLTAYYQAITQGKYKRSNLNITNTRNLRQEVYTSEMQSIKDKAIADGTFMKAPNGNPTNLNERQWLQVRTKAFKDWFGDWEKVAPSTESAKRLVSYVTDISNRNNRFSKLAQLVLDNKALPYNLKYFKIDNNRDDIEGYSAMWHSLANLIEVLGNNVSQESIDKAILHELIHYNTEQLLRDYKDNKEIPATQKEAIKNLYDIIEYSKNYLSKELQTNRDKYIEIAKRQSNTVNSRLFYAFDNTGSVEIDEFISEIFTNPGLQEVLNEIPYKETKQSLWSKIKNAISSIFGFDINKGSVLEEALKEASKLIQNNSNVSKVVDENGEPLVVYHGTSEDFNIFKTDINLEIEDKQGNLQNVLNLPNSIYATSNEVMATTYYENESFLDKQLDDTIERIYEAEYKGIISLEEMNKRIKEAKDEYNKRKKLLKGKNMPLFVNLRNVKIIDAKNSNWNKINDNGIIKSTRDLEEENRDKDGVIIYNVFDFGGRGGYIGYQSSTVFIINKANNVKSVTDNTGEFSTTNDDIRFRTVDDNSKVMKRESQRFLDNFGITIKEVEEFGGEEKLFDALNRVINVRNADDISEGVGEAIAFMMQHNGTMETLIKYKLQEVPKSIRRSIRKRGDFDALASTKHLDNEERQKYVKEIGKEIATELRKLYRVEPINVKPETFLAKLWEIITEFFDKLTPAAKTKFNILRNYTKNIANSVKLNDPSIVLTTDYKPGTTEKAARVDIGKALRENPYERRIIEYLNSKNIALAGSASIALEGTLYRPSENPLHDIDFNAGNYSKEELDNVIKEHFPHSTFVREITDGKDRITETYLVLDRPFVTRKPVSGIAGIELYDKETGKKLGSYVGSELFLEKGVQGKFLDFFLGEGNNRYPYKVHNINGKSYLVSDVRNAFTAKIEWARPKDIWDYNRFTTEDQLGRITERREQEKNRIKEKLESARIIWGHPAIGKTTYLERNQDILEWDQEVNDKRNRFFRDQIDPEHKLDPSSKEYKQLRSQYMSEWREHPEYVKFLTDEWENLKERARKENKRLFASPAPLLEIGADDFDLYVNIPEKSFLERNTRRGGTPLGSMGWKQIVNNALVRVDPDKIVTTDKYFSEFMRDNLGVQWGTLTNEEARELEKKGWTKEQFERVSQPERERAVKCAVL